MSTDSLAHHILCCNLPVLQGIFHPPVLSGIGQKIRFGKTHRERPSSRQISNQLDHVNHSGQAARNAVQYVPSRRLPLALSRRRRLQRHTCAEVIHAEAKEIPPRVRIIAQDGSSVRVCNSFHVSRNSHPSAVRAGSAPRIHNPARRILAFPFPADGHSACRPRMENDYYRLSLGELYA